MVYTLLFVTKNEDKVVIPDPTGSRRNNGLGGQTLSLSDSLPFLRTCQLVHEEATSLLYGVHIFHFDDTAHHDKDHKVVEFDVVLPYCDYITMYPFLTAIGLGNRRKLRHIQLEFSDEIFVQYPEEARNGRIWVMNYHHGGAAFVGDALESLSVDHALQTVSISFNAQQGSLPAWRPFHATLFFYVVDQGLARKLSQISGIKDFKRLTDFEPFDLDTHEWIERSLQYINEKHTEMKEKMQAGRSGLARFDLGTTFGFISEPASQIEDVIVRDPPAMRKISVPL